MSTTLAHAAHAAHTNDDMDMGTDTSPEAKLKSRLSYLFGPMATEQWYYQPQYLSFITPEIVANNVFLIADDLFNGLSDKVVWDMFAGIGTDTIRLSKLCGKIVSTELCPETYAELRKNIESRGITNVTTLLGDCHQYVDQIQSDIVYFDPPWGDQFQTGQKYEFTKDIIDLVLKVHEKSHLIIKSPFNSTSFERLFNSAETLATTAYRQPKLKFLFIAAANA